MTRFDQMKGIFGLLPTPYREDLEIHTEDLKKVAAFCCESGQHGIVWRGKAEDLAQQLGAAVHHLGMVGEVGGRVHQPHQLHHPHHAVEVAVEAELQLLEHVPGPHISASKLEKM